jgi:hypothetical protein
MISSICLFGATRVHDDVAVLSAMLLLAGEGAVDRNKGDCVAS